MALKCQCGKTLDDRRGAKGHVKFKDDDTHGEKMTLPDDWESLFESIDSDEQEESDDGGGSDDPDHSETKESSPSDSDGSDGGGRLRRYLTTPLDELVTGGSE